MFTGIIEGLGKIQNINRKGPDLELTVQPLFEASDVGIGDSISVDGVCLTVTAVMGKEIQLDVSAETLARSTIGSLNRGDEVNLERALKLGDRLGGHLVSGHIDGVGRIQRKLAKGNSFLLRVAVDKGVARYLVEKGSVAVDGISLTVNRCQGDWFEVNIIPQTARETTILRKRVGDKVNVEADMIGKYVEKFLVDAREEGGKKTGDIDRDLLSRYGFQGFGE